MRLLKWAGVGAGVVVCLGVLAFGFVFLKTEARINREYQVTPAPLADSRWSGEEGDEVVVGHPEMADDNGMVTEAVLGEEGAGLLEWGEHIAVTRGCVDCHGEDLGGALFADDMPVFRLSASNLTPGGVGGTYTDTDWVRAIRHGIGPAGKPLLFMPSYEYYYLSDHDLYALVEYLKSLKPVARELEPNKVGPLGRVLFMAGELPLVPAEMIDHHSPRPTSPPPGVTVEYGEYLAVGCTGCHGPGFSGGPIPGVPPEWPEASNITPDPETGLGEWGRGDFVRAMTEGRRPDGTELRAAFMPWPNFAQFEADELEAMWLYLRSLDPRPKGGR